MTTVQLEAPSARVLESADIAKAETKRASLAFSSTVGLVLRSQEIQRLELQESSRLILKAAQSTQFVFVQSQQNALEDIQINWISQVDPYVATAVGTGIVIWFVHAGQVAAALLSTASTWVQLDPLTVLQGTDDTEASELCEEKMFDGADRDRAK